MLVGHAQRPLAAHAHAQQREPRRPRLPPLGHVGHDPLEHVAFGRDVGIELRPDAFGPPTQPALRLDHTQSVADELSRELREALQRRAAAAVQVDDRVAMFAGVRRLEQATAVAGQLDFAPGSLGRIHNLLCCRPLGPALSGPAPRPRRMGPPPEEFGHGKFHGKAQRRKAVAKELNHFPNVVRVKRSFVVPVATLRESFICGFRL